MKAKNIKNTKKILAFEFQRKKKLFEFLEKKYDWRFFDNLNPSRENWINR